MPLPYRFPRDRLWGLVSAAERYHAGSCVSIWAGAIWVVQPRAGPASHVWGEGRMKFPQSAVATADLAKISG